MVGAIPARHEVRIFDLNQEPQPDALAALLLDYQPDLVGLSIRNIDNTDGSNSKGFIEDFKTVIATVRTACKAPIVLGGSGFTIFPEALMEVLNADYGIPGDGERISLLLDALESKAPMEGIPDILVRGKHFKTDKTLPVPIPVMPQMCRRFDAHSSHLQHYLRHSGTMNLQTKRGCPFHCIYCTYPYIDGARLRLHDPAEVAQTAMALQKAGAKYLFITDSTFNCSVQHSMAVAKAFIEIGLSIPWGAFFAPLAIPGDYFKTMAKAGLTHVEFGTESLSDKVLATYKKPFNKRDVFQAHEVALDAGLHVAHYLMLGGPGEDEETLEETLVSAESLKKSAFFFFCGIRIYPHTALYDIALSEGQITADQDLLSPVFYRSGHLTNEGIEAKVTTHAAGRMNWVTGSGGEEMEKLLSRMHARGRVGPLWEQIIP